MNSRQPTAVAQLPAILALRASVCRLPTTDVRGNYEGRRLEVERRLLKENFEVERRLMAVECRKKGAVSAPFFLRLPACSRPHTYRQCSRHSIARADAPAADGEIQVHRAGVDTQASGDCQVVEIGRQPQTEW